MIGGGVEGLAAMSGRTREFIEPAEVFPELSCVEACA